VSAPEPRTTPAYLRSDNGAEFTARSLPSSGWVVSETPAAGSGSHAAGLAAAVILVSQHFGSIRLR
jgi:hypothetical protein